MRVRHPGAEGKWAACSRSWNGAGRTRNESRIASASRRRCGGP
jgi:hypothetical protein